MVQMYVQSRSLHTNCKSSLPVLQNRLTSSRVGCGNAAPHAVWVYVCNVRAKLQVSQLSISHIVHLLAVLHLYDKVCPACALGHVHLTQ